MSDRRIYIGPSLPRWGLYFGMVFSDGLTPTALAAADKCPRITGLIVPVSRTTASRAEMSRRGTALNTCRNAVLTAYGKEE